MQLHVLAAGFDPKSPISLGGQGPHLTQCVFGPHKHTCQMASKSVERFQQGGAIPPNNNISIAVGTLEISKYRTTISCML